MFPMQWLQLIFLICHGRDYLRLLNWLNSGWRSCYTQLRCASRHLWEISSTKLCTISPCSCSLFLHSTTVSDYTFNLLLTYVLKLHTWLNISEALTKSWADWNSSPFWDMFWDPVGPRFFWIFCFLARLFPAFYSTFCTIAFSSSSIAVCIYFHSI